MFERHRERFFSARAEDSERAVVDIGILTRGKPTLGITLSSLLLQDTRQLRIHIVDTGDSPVVNRDDVTQAMRLAFDREIHCAYERLRECMRGPFVCFVDDDMALSATVVSQLLGTARRQAGDVCVGPKCLNATLPLGSAEHAHGYTPGSLFSLDDDLRRLLARYYEETVDVVDAVKASEKVWEVAFLGELFARLGRPFLPEPMAVIYHLDHHELSNWSLSDGTAIRHSIALARQLAGGVDGRSLAV
ncbi:MAG: glycosyltransferase family A protein [Chloroflexota bacterium]